MPRHIKVCKRKRRQELARASEAVAPATNDEDPLAEGTSHEAGPSELPDYEKGGQFVLFQFDAWLNIVLDYTIYLLTVYFYIFDNLYNLFLYYIMEIP